MAFKKRKWSKYRSGYLEKPKDHGALPDTLDTGYVEENDGNGLFIYLQKQPTLYVVLGKYRFEQKNGVLYYVADFTSNSINAEKVYKFDHLLLAIAQVHELVEQFEERIKDEDLHG